MKHIKPFGVNEMRDPWDDDPSAPWNQDPDPEPQREKELTQAEKLFTTLAYNTTYAVLSKKGVRGELWLFLLESVDGVEQFMDFIDYFEKGGWDWSEKEYDKPDEYSIEDFATCVYRGDFKDDKWLKPSEAICEDPNKALDSYENGPEFIIRISGGLAERLLEDFGKDYAKSKSVDYKTGLKGMMNAISKVYPEGRLLPGEEPLDIPET